MTRAFWWMGAALAAALWAAPADRALAQASADAAAGAATEAAGDVSASGSTDAASSSASGSIDATDSADTSASTSGSAQADTSAARTQTDTQASGSATTDQSSTSATGSVQGSTGTTPSTSTDASAQTGVNANANLDASAQANQATAPSTQTEAAAAGSTNVDANLQGQAGLQAQQGTNVQAGLNTQAQTMAQQQLRSGLQFGQPTAQGLAINTLEPSNLFFNSGIRPGDVLVSYAGRPVRSQADFWRYAVWQPGQRIPVIVMRDGRQQTIYVTYQQQPGIQHQAAYAPQSQAYLGVTFDANAMHAAVVRTVTPGSPAEQAGLRAGDHIVALNGNRVQNANDVIRTVQTLQPGASLDIAFTRPVENRTQVTLGQRPGVAQASYGPDVRVQTYGAAPSVPAPPTPPSTTVQPVPATVQSGAQIESSADPTPRVDRPADFDDDGRTLDRDQRVNRVGRDRGRPGGIR